VATRTLIVLFVIAAIAFATSWRKLERRNSASVDPIRPSDAVIGFGTNFFDALGIGNFAPTTALYKVLRRMPDEQVPGTLNVGHALPALASAIVFTGTVDVDFETLVIMIGFAVLGAWWGAGRVVHWPRRAIQLGMGGTLAVAALVFTMANLRWIPGGGVARGLAGPPLILAASVNFMLGALSALGIGLYAPCLIVVSLLGMNPIAAFPIMMGSCAFLMPIAGIRFIRARRYSFGAALGLTVGGVPGVLIAVYLVKSMPLYWLRWLVVFVVSCAAAMMLRAGLTPLSRASRN
jgi:uncharacterized membrane protein YfcA